LPILDCCFNQIEIGFDGKLQFDEKLISKPFLGCAGMDFASCNDCGNWNSLQIPQFGFELVQST
jgi:hypothetical protein